VEFGAAGVSCAQLSSDRARVRIKAIILNFINLLIKVMSINVMSTVDGCGQFDGRGGYKN
jgi:hypothetical protein